MKQVEGGMQVSKQELAALMQKADADSFTSTPQAITPKIIKFCERLNGKPVYVPVDEVTNAPLNECFRTVEKRVASDGGSMEVGWAVWEWPGIFLEAEHHSVWLDPGGRRLDVAPKMHGEKRILFVPDPKSPYCPGKRTGNRRMPLRDNDKIRDFIGAARRSYDLTGGDSMAPYKVTEELEYAELYRIGLMLKLRAMTDRKLVEAARVAARLPL